MEKDSRSCLFAVFLLLAFATMVTPLVKGEPEGNATSKAAVSSQVNHSGNLLHASSNKITSGGNLVTDNKRNYGGGGGGGGRMGGSGSWGWGWGGGGGGGGSWSWGCGGSPLTKRGKKQRPRKGRVFGREDYKTGEFAQCLVGGRCGGMRLDCPLHCGGPCFYDCRYMCKAHCRRRR